MKIPRWFTWEARIRNWCANCGNTSTFKQIKTGMPGICCDECLTCGISFQVNHLEDRMDLLEVDKNFIFPKWDKTILDFYKA